MGSALPWALVALCFALGVASRSISDTFLVFVPALQHAFDANRGSVTLIYSFALLVGGTAAPITGWILDRFGLRALTVVGVGRGRGQPPPSPRRRAISGTSICRSG